LIVAVISMERRKKSEVKDWSRINARSSSKGQLSAFSIAHSSIYMLPRFDTFPFAPVCSNQSIQRHFISSPALIQDAIFGGLSANATSSSREFSGYQ